MNNADSSVDNGAARLEQEAGRAGILLRGKLYVNEAAKAVLEALIAEAALVGATFIEPSLPSKMARSRV